MQDAGQFLRIFTHNIHSENIFTQQLKKIFEFYLHEKIRRDITQYQRCSPNG